MKTMNMGRWDIKGYLRHKTITSQNVPSKAQIKNFFISQKNYVLKIFKFLYF